ncbi:zinc finger protein 37 [Cephus cinctus]|uniref:Zinc finger protein 37 n=1 Tax=Cephus cinctus TaxID=211228 RepID=A0AAJ7BW93_CEPCN|nr:zinc finger protein 37 [Cephus cinctus]XP_015595933.1 zinc finger protein 37 [Cephus cinctus]XP_015595935.1 zinc finger protein 37 [Cephus cinctus]XP_024941120.1 zinc finger protein 37 [Cephus cinctus]
MEVTTEDAAQAVLLERMEGTQYITIQRQDGESLGKGVPLLALNGELIPEGMVVDMINAGVGSEYTTTTQYYETEEDLLPHELTEDDRRLAAALVAVQLQQQQKQQQLHSQQQHEDPTLPDVSHLEPLSPVNAYTIQSMPDPDPPSVYPTLQPLKRISQNVKQEFINIKSEYDVDVSAESSEDAAPTPGPKRSLPHKKRIPRKLKQQSKKNPTRRDNARLNQDISVETTTEVQVHAYRCELCGSRFSGQLKFFEHLKAHYEPVKQEARIAQATNTSITMSVTESVQGLDNSVIEEFDEPEDLMEGIRGVVEEIGAHIDEDIETPLVDVNNGPPLWAIADVSKHTEQEEIQATTINEDDLQEKEETDIPETAKKKKLQKSRKNNDELVCPQCGRSFNHKNSLVYHMRSHSGERPHQCEVCGKSFFAASALKVHKRLHSGDKPYKCEDCGRHFRQWGDLKYHSTSIHSEQKQFQCEYCGKDFARKYSLIVHRRIHTGEKNYRCEFCHKTFRASSYLQNHRRIHTGEKPHPCTVCGKPFRVRSDMKRHMHTHSRGRPARPPNRIVAGKSLNEESDKNSQARTIQSSIVQDLKLEVEPGGVVEIGPPEDNPESILPHEGGQTLEYTVATSTDNGSDRDPLEAVVRTTDNLQYFFI